MTNNNFWQLMFNAQTDIAEKYKKMLVDSMERIKSLEIAVNLTLEENGNLADGDNCTLIHLKKVIGVE